MISQQELTNCDKEPIHIPGSIQPIGFLLLIEKNSMSVITKVGNIKTDFVGKKLLTFWPEVQKVFDEIFDQNIVYGNAMLDDSLYSIRIHAQQNNYILEAMEYEAKWRSNEVLMEEFYSIFERPLSKATIYQQICKYLKELSGFERVMLYRFEKEGHGQVVGEAKTDEYDSYLYHSFPASDIPVQARALYVKNRVRFIANVEHETIALDTNFSTLDMSECILRAVSPIHIEYLKNMNVIASMSVSIVIDNKLWGLIACHHRSERSISFENMKLLNILSYICSRELLRMENEAYYTQKDSIDNALNHIFSKINYTSKDYRSTKLVEHILRKLSHIYNCNDVIVISDQDYKAISNLPKPFVSELKKRLEYDEFFETDHFDEDDVIRKNYAHLCSGAMGIVLKSEQKLQIWFVRQEISSTIIWAGNPAKDSTDGIISPRSSFESWEEVQKNKSIPWSQAEKDTALDTVKTELLRLYFSSETEINPQDIVNKSASSMIITDPNQDDNPIIEVNEAFTQLYGYTLKEVIGKNPRILHGHLIDKVSREKFKKGLKQKKQLTILVQNITKWGETIWVMNNIIPIFDNLGKLRYYIGSQYNVTDMKKEFKDLHYNDQYLTEMLGHNENLLLITDGKKIKYVNIGFLSFFGFESLEKFKEKHDCICEMFIPNETYFHMVGRKKDESWIHEIMKLPQEKRIVYLMSKSFQTHAFSVSINPANNGEYIVSLSDISRGMDQQLHLLKTANEDKLTGANNRYYLEKNIEAIEAVAKKTQNKIGIIMADIDHFKQVNDTFGHGTGDIVLASFVKLLKKQLREEDKVIRWGGEEFLILTLVKKTENIVKIVNGLCTRIAANSINPVGKITASFGATVLKENEELENGIQRADELLYKAKNNGRNQYQTDITN